MISENNINSKATLLLTPAIEDWIQHTILNDSPTQFGYDTSIWTYPILAMLLLERFGVLMSEMSIRQRLKVMGLVTP